MTAPALLFVMDHMGNEQGQKIKRQVGNTGKRKEQIIDRQRDNVIFQRHSGCDDSPGGGKSDALQQEHGLRFNQGRTAVGGTRRAMFQGSEIGSRRLDEL